MPLWDSAPFISYLTFGCNFPVLVAFLSQILDLQISFILMGFFSPLCLSSWASYQQANHTLAPLFPAPFIHAHCYRNVKFPSILKTITHTWDKCITQLLKKDR